LGCEFDWHGPRDKLLKINILVDMVSGRAFPAAPWTDKSFSAVETELLADNAHIISNPEPRIVLTKPHQTAPAVAQLLVRRKLRFARVCTCDMITRDVQDLKRSRYIIGVHRGLDFVLSIDGVTEKHYVFSGLILSKVVTFFHDVILYVSADFLPRGHK